MRWPVPAAIPALLAGIDVHHRYDLIPGVHRIQKCHAFGTCAPDDAPFARVRQRPKPRLPGLALAAIIFLQRRARQL